MNTEPKEKEAEQNNTEHEIDYDDIPELDVLQLEDIADLELF